MPTKPLVFFIHGLNTFGDDQFHFGPLALGPMNQHWKPALEGAGYAFFAVDEMGFGAFEEQVDRAARKIECVLAELPAEQSHNVHLFGHSMGGLVARGVGARLMESPHLVSRSRLCSIITLGTPHGGTIATEDALDLQKNRPGFHRFLKFLGYDIEERREAIRYFTIDKIKAFTERHPELLGVTCVSLVGAAKRRQLGLPFQLFYRRLHPNGESELSDGLITASSQAWARVAGTFELDHGAELGLFTNALPSERRFAASEFQRLVDTVVTVIKSADKT